MLRLVLALLLGVALATPAGADAITSRWAACTPKKVTIKNKDIPTAEFDVALSGGTGVFFVHKTKNGQRYGKGVTVKFTRAPEPGTLVARKILAKMKLPHDTLVLWSEAAGKVTDFHDMFDNARQTGKFPAAKSQRVQQLLNRIEQNQPGSVLVTSHAEPAGSGETFGELLSVGTNLSFVQKRVAALDLIEAMRALAQDYNQQFLGALYVTDLMLGNGDRLSRESGPNWNNILLTDKGCLIAIDNDVVAPSRVQVLFNQANNHNAPRTGLNVQLSYQAGDYVDALVVRFDDHVSSIPAIGPSVAFAATLLPANGQQPTCFQRVASHSAVSGAEMARLIADLQRLINNSVAELGRNPMVNVVQVQNPVPLAHQTACHDVVTYTTPVGGVQHTATIDWRIFEQNFQRGVDRAISFFTARSNSSFLSSSANNINSYDGLERASREGIVTRIDFLKERMATGHLSQQVIATMKQRASKYYSEPLNRTFGKIALYDDWDVYLFE